MGSLVETASFLPIPNTEAAVFRKSFGQRATAVVATLALSMSAAAPLPIAQDTFGCELLKSGIPEFGWGGKCETPGQRITIRRGDLVSVAQCKPNKVWYNAGYLNNVPKIAIR